MVRIHPFCTFSFPNTVYKGKEVAYFQLSNVKYFSYRFKCQISPLRFEEDIKLLSGVALVNGNHGICYQNLASKHAEGNRLPRQI